MTATASHHPDAELLAAYERWRAACCAWAAELDRSDRAQARWRRATFEAMREVARLPVRTLDGVVAKLRVAVHQVAVDVPDLNAPVPRDTEIAANALVIERDRVLLQAVGALERLAAGGGRA